MLILVMRATDIIGQWLDTRGIQVGIDISNQRDIYRLSMVG